MPLTPENLLDMSQDELDNLFRASPAGPIPEGEGEGTVLFAPDTTVGDIAAKVAQLAIWKGKVFDPARGQLVNKLLPWGALAIAAKVFKGISWFDGKEAVILDYSETSIAAQYIRDEIRLVAPGLYLGVVYWEKTKILNFALDFPAS